MHHIQLMEDSVASGAEGEFFMRQKRTHFYDGLEALEHDVTSNNGLLWDWWAECPALQVRFPSSARFHLQHVCLRRNYGASSQSCLAYVSPFHYSAALILEWPSEGLVYYYYFVVYLFCCSFLRILNSWWIYVKALTHFDPFWCTSTCRVKTFCFRICIVLWKRMSSQWVQTN